MTRRWAVRGVVLGLMLLAPGLVRAAGPASPCLDAIRAAEGQAHVPAGLLQAIGLVESGRARPGGGTEPWPWSINVAGAGAQFDSKDAAVAAVQAAQRNGVRSIDVGCMQVNLQHHPDAFASLDEAFDPAHNATYAASFLVRLFGRTQSWGDAAAAYHSQSPERGEVYRQKVAAWWPVAGLGHVAPARPDLVNLDPYGIYTPAFRARLAQDAADRNRHMGQLAPQRTVFRSILAPPTRGRQFAKSGSGVEFH